MTVSVNCTILHVAGVPIPEHYGRALGGNIYSRGTFSASSPPWPVSTTLLDTDKTLCACPTNFRQFFAEIETYLGGVFWTVWGAFAVEESFGLMCRVNAQERAALPKGAWRASH
ncbi:uncharacterized protein LJ206_010324 [Theristicus caerulescens]